ncbi:RNA polymerase sigma factor [Saltatorellus ferox]|uniref:RNA polymerase sigma factor n=1 Tax=Saltatorellus ferox TaxID=2528018 RepID=UPI003AF3C4C7
MSTESTSGSSSALSIALEHADWLRGLAGQLVLDGAEAEDVYQETLLAARTARRPVHVGWKPWLAGVARNVARTRRRGQRRARARESEAAEQRTPARSALEDAALLEQQRALLAAVERLPENQRRAILARFYDGQPPREIARVEGVPVATIDSRMQRALAALRADLDEAYGDRSTWATMLLPLASLSPKSPLGAGGIALAALAGVAAVAGLMWTGPLIGARTGAASPTIEVLTVALDPPTSSLREETESTPAEISPPEAEERSSRARRLPVSPREFRVSVLDDGQAIVGAEVFHGSTEDLKAEASISPTVRQTLWNAGQRAITGPDGSVMIQGTPPIVLEASSELGAGYGWIEGGARGATIELTPARRLTVEVRGSDGAVLAAEEAAETRVVAFHSYRPPQKASRDATEVLDYYDRERIGIDESLQVRDGEVYFQNAWLGRSTDEHPFDTSVWNRIAIDAVGIDIPGACEFEPEAVSTDRFRPFKRKAGGEVRKLRLPPLGSLRFVAIDSQGQLSALNGTLSLRFKKPVGDSDFPRSYTAEVREGVADFPRFVTGSRPFRYTLSSETSGLQIQGDATGPELVGQRRVVTVRHGGGPVVTARVVDPNGRPMAQRRVSLEFFDRRRGRTLMQGMVHCTSSDDGAVRFEIPEEHRHRRCFAIHVRESEFVGVPEALYLWDLPDDAVTPAMDLGDVTLKFLESAVLRGVVVDVVGQPVPDVHVVAFVPGYECIEARSDHNGSFVLQALQAENLCFETSKRDGSLLTQVHPLEPSAWEKPVRLVVSSGATFIASIDESGFVDDLAAVHGFLKSESDPDVHAFLQRTPEGSWEAHAVSPGRYRLFVRLNGNVPLIEVPGIEIPAAGRVSDPRVDALRLRDHIRALNVTWEGLPKRAVPRLEVRSLDPRPSVSGLLKTDIHSTNGEAVFLVPTRLPASARFHVYDGRAVYFSDVAQLEGELHLTFPDSLRVRAVLVGVPSEGYRYELVGEEGTPVGGAQVRVPAADPRADPAADLELEFPAEGRYRLQRDKIQEPVSMGGGLMNVGASHPESIGALLEVRAGETLRIRFTEPAEKSGSGVTR